MKKWLIVKTWFFAVTGLLFLTGCKREKEINPERINVVATIPALADFSRQIGGERISVITLLPPGSSPHTFEPTPSQAGAAEDADLIVRIGLDVDHWIDDLLPKGKSVVTASSLEGIELINENVTGHEKQEAHRQGANPHIWLDPLYAKIIASAISEKLSSIDPEGKHIYEKNEVLYEARLDSLHSRITDSLKNLASRKYVSFHPAWLYFAARYGLERISVIMESAGKEPSPRSLEEVVEKIKKEGARMVFAEPQLSPKAAEIIADEAGVGVFFLDPLGRKNETYIELMDRNLTVILQALGEE
ncbi:hypothetical protein GF359_02960 [candidate division WOR-3 bacterium]|uniref:Zinc ABC transporter substrate-binding protein n=1 Tax=candidate division WOR-3 bacterium TaxID=2052148 RepID=A0A9D5QC50_UNCW3|nr:hypothetical protein [candidate division WOR-3 bacterium]MBD3364154.1 hypothetical protein [candidate division WOR-3 bacterium]